jgi:hypothetical protein
MNQRIPDTPVEYDEWAAVDWLFLDETTRIANELILDMGWGNFPLEPYMISLN